MNQRMRFHVCLSFVLIIICAIDLRAQVSAPGWTPPGKQPAQRRLAPSDLARRGEAPMIRLHPEIKFESVALRSLSSPGPSEVKQKRKGQRLRIGVIRPLGDPIDSLAGMTAFNAQGIPNGRLYIARLISKDALSVRLHFTNVSLPKGARLFVYSANNFDNFFGPYEANGPNGDGEFWTPPVYGDSAVIEYFSPDAAGEAQAAPFRVAQISHAFIDEGAAIPGQGPGACNAGVPTEWAEAAKSVARLRFISAGGEYLCTGALLNTTDNSGMPYVLTANHCFNTQAEAATLVATWLYDFGDYPFGRPDSNGSYLLATGAHGDFTLVELRFPVPNGVRFSGWTTGITAPGTAVASIHHPFGSYKRFSSGATLAANCPPDFPGQFCDDLLKVRWSSGVTEPGSSGGPLFVGNPSDPRLAGALLGGSSACDNRDGADYFSRFDQTFEAIRFYLTGEGCAYELSAPERLIEAGGGARNVNVMLREGDPCAWIARSTAPWIKINGAANGSGDGRINYEVEPNPTAQTRYGFLIIANQTLAITQLGVNNNCAPSPLTPGQPVNANLSYNDCRSVIDESVYADRYTFNAKAGQGITISLRSAQFDGFLTLINSAGEIIAQNDNAPIYGGARIPAGGTFVAPADDIYTVEATSVDANAVGGYILELNLTGCVHAATLETASFGHLVATGRWW